MDTQSTKKIKNPPPITLDHLSTSHQIPNNLGMLENHLQNTLESPSEWVLNWILIHCCSRHQCIRVSPEFYSSRFIFLGSHWLLINAGEKLGWSKKKKKKTTKTGLRSQKRDAWVIRKKKWWGVHIRAWQLVRFHTDSLLGSMGIGFAAHESWMVWDLRPSPLLSTLIIQGRTQWQSNSLTGLTGRLTRKDSPSLHAISGAFKTDWYVTTI